MRKTLGQIRNSWQSFASLTLALGLILLPGIAFGASSGAISQSFSASSSDIAEGTILSLQLGTSSVVEPANSDTSASSLEGVAADKPLVELSGNQQNTIQVVVSGITPVLVSNINGSINSGDRIAPSPISGVGMKAITPTEVIGTAQANLSSVTTVTKQITNKSGQQVAVKIGLIPVAINVSYYSSTSTNGNLAAYIPPFLQNLANSVAGGKSVSPFRVLVGTVGLLLGFATVGLMLYTSIRSGMTSIGRNPLAQGALRRGLVDVLVAALGILVVTALLVYIVVAK